MVSLGDGSAVCEKGLCGDCGHQGEEDGSERNHGSHSGSQPHMVRLGLFLPCGRGGGSPGAKPSPPGEELLSGEQRAGLGLLWTESSRATAPLPLIPIAACAGRVGSREQSSTHRLMGVPELWQFWDRGQVCEAARVRCWLLSSAVLF